jgi:hypothetical protein
VDDDESSMKSSKAHEEIVRPTGGGRHGLAVPCCLRAEVSQADRKRSPWVGGPVLPACRG